jgi:methionine-rich copper-binding protein CopC
MSLRLFATLVLASVGLLAAQSDADAQAVTVLETGPAPHAVIDGSSDGFFVRFDRPIDHIHSRLVIKRGNDVVEGLQPRFKSAPEVLFARAPTLPPGEYTLHWIVRTLEGTDVVEGEVPFSIGPQKPTTK